MIIIVVTSLGSAFTQVSWSVVPNESFEAFSSAYNGIRAAVFDQFKKGAVRLCARGAGCGFCAELRDIQESLQVVKVLNIVNNPPQ